MEGGLRAVERGSDDDCNRLERLVGFPRHALQGRKTLDYHTHKSLEQVYYILSGKGGVLFDDKRYPAECSDAICLPSGIPRQMFNETNEAWLEHHVVSMRVEGDGGKFTIRNWNQASL